MGTVFRVYLVLLMLHLATLAVSHLGNALFPDLQNLFKMPNIRVHVSVTTKLFFGPTNSPGLPLWNHKNFLRVWGGAVNSNS